MRVDIETEVGIILKAWEREREKQSRAAEIAHVQHEGI